VRAWVTVRIVVLDLVVVPDAEEVVGCVHPLQVRVGLVEAVLLPVLRKRLDMAVVVMPVASVRTPLRVSGLVDVVTEADDQVDVLLIRHRGLGVVEAGLVLLAGVEEDLERALRVQRRTGPEGANLGVRVVREEAIEVLVVGPEAVDPGAER